MKKTILLFALVVLISCKQEQETVDYAILSVKIENTTAKKMNLFDMYDLTTKREIELKDDGSFVDTIPVKENHFFMLVEGSRGKMTPLYMTKGDALIVSYNSSDVKSSTTFKGKEKAINEYLSIKNKKTKELIPSRSKTYSLEEGKFLNTIAKVKTEQLKILKEALSISEDFRTNEIKNIEYENLFHLDYYATYHGYYTKNPDFKVSEAYQNKLDDKLKNLERSNEEDFVFSDHYRNIIRNELRNKATIVTEQDSAITKDFYTALLTVIDDEVSNEMIKNKLLFNNTVYMSFSENVDDFYAAFTKASTNEENNKIVEKKYNDIKKLSKGAISPKFFNYENYAGGTTSLDDLKGQYLYIDIWATWCGPCIREIPALKKLEEEYKDKNIAFVSISIDVEKDYEKWKKMIADKELGGTQLLADSDWNSKFIKDYQIQGIPRFIILDPDGKIVNSSAPRPSDKKLLDIFNQLKL